MKKMMSSESNLSNLVLYEVYVRNHGPNGTFSDVIRDLGRIASLGVDFIWLMPIHPIGNKNKKGTLGCPYAIKDYQKINPEYGTLNDFKKLLEEAHHRGLRVMIDVVYNHTSHDSNLVNEHPEYFHQDENGKPITTVPAWSDVIDLKHPNPPLQDYLIDTLCYWVGLGVDGFRCDVASIIPLSFWLEARKHVNRINPEVVWLAESVHTAWVIERRREGLLAHSDAELYQVFDLTYDYDIWQAWQGAVQGTMPVKRYLEMVVYQEGIFPKGAVKMRCVENHDNARIMALAPNKVSAKAWTAFQLFNQGAFLLYAGQESGTDHTPSLFDIDKIDWADYCLQDWLKRLIAIKKMDIFSNGKLVFLAAEPVIQAIWQNQDTILYGIFNISSTTEPIQCQLVDGVYQDLISGHDYAIRDGSILMEEKSALILLASNDFHPNKLIFELLEFKIN